MKQKPKELTCNKHVTQVSNCYTSKPKELDKWLNEDKSICKSDREYILSYFDKQKTEIINDILGLEELKNELPENYDEENWSKYCDGSWEDYSKKVDNDELRNKIKEKLSNLLNKKDIKNIIEKDDGIVKRIISHIYLKHKKEFSNQKIEIINDILGLEGFKEEEVYPDSCDFDPSPVRNRFRNQIKQQIIDYKNK